MTQDETVALFLECEAKRREARAAALAEGKDKYDADNIAHEAAKAHWNAWAEPLLAERKAMEADGRWAAEKNLFGSLEPKNTETRTWMEKAAADFSRCLFLLRGVEGTKETAGEHSREDDIGALPVKSIQLEGDRADLSGFLFPGNASFVSATFTGNARFVSATFTGYAYFGSATFTGNASFVSATFTGNANFVSATFTGNAYFGSATFTGYAYFVSATFTGYARFGSATFTGDANFESATFTGYAYFVSATFTGNARFGSATFTGYAYFVSATFTGNAHFRSATFTGDASFGSATFEKDVFFGGARFASPASFALCNFRQHATFAASRFATDASFEAIRGERGFNMAAAVFEVVPDFIQAHFEEAPRLDNLQVGWRLPRLKELDDEEREALNKRQRLHRRGIEKSRSYRRVAEAAAKDSDLRNIPARWRALKRLAIQGHDTERELEFHSRELRSQRFAEDWPLPLALWRVKAWAGFFRFWSGYLYQWFSDYGRSLARPLIASWLVLIAAAAFFLSQTEAMQARLGLREASYVSGTVQTALHAFAAPAPCYLPPPAPVERWRKHWPWLHRNVNTPASRIDGLVEPFRSQTNARAEALHLAVRNAFVVLDGLGEAAHRTFGCLYGVELYGGSTPMAIVPSAVSTVSAAQKLFSAVMIFLFGLALRNMLKMK